MTGAEAGTCKAVTGTPYMSFEHSSSCGLKRELKSNIVLWGLLCRESNQ
ncbi:hypothetical protein THIOSC15_3280003 [uncultured Thiomicrorhabdus sp.]